MGLAGIGQSRGLDNFSAPDGFWVISVRGLDNRGYYSARADAGSLDSVRDDRVDEEIVSLLACGRRGISLRLCDVIGSGCNLLRID